MPWHKVIIMVSVTFSAALAGTLIGGCIGWLIFETNKAFGLGLPPGLIIGGVVGYFLIDSKLKTPEGGNYCYCTSDIV